MHPDEPTGRLVDMALQTGKSFAVVPCCVFAKLYSLFGFHYLSLCLSSRHPDRTLKDGRAVKMYPDLIEWILEKDPRIQQETLDISGRRIVLWLDQSNLG